MPFFRILIIIFTYNILGDIMINFKKLLLSLAIPLGAGGIGYLLSGNNTQIYESINRPNFAPPGFIFPIAWAILYILMGISYYLVVTSKDTGIRKRSLNVYYIQLILNSLWSLVFFRFRLFFIGFLWVLALIGLVLYMIYLFVKSNKVAGYLQIPYILWLVFAGALSFSIFRLN